MNARRLLIIGLLATCLARLAHAIQITEVMYHPPTNEDQREWIELHNEASSRRDLGGWEFAEGIDYVFPEGTVIEAGAYLVLARDPAVIGAVYGIANVIGPFTGRLANGSDHIILYDQSGGIMAEVDYVDRGQWPTAADGTGHSLSKRTIRSDPMDAGNWAPSATIGGTPGRANDLLPEHPLIVINEVHFTVPGQQYVELYNRAAFPVDIGGHHLSNNPNFLNQFTMPSPMLMPPGARVIFQTATLGFTLDVAEDRILFTGPALNAVIDARTVEAGPAGWAEGRWPDGADDWHYMQPTLAAPNAVALNTAIVINEIMYHPPSNDVADEYVELYNKGNSAISLAGWRFSRGIDYDFPTTAILNPRAYCVVAKDRQRLAARYGLDPAAVYGNFSGQLADSDEKVRLRDANSNVADEVHYYDAGNWSKYADGYGSSLELIDPTQDNANHLAWRPSDETAKAQWTFISYTGDITPDADAHEHELHLHLMGPGVTLIDDVQLTANSTNYIANGNFESGVGAWVIMGNHVHSEVTAAAAHSGSLGLKLVASGGGTPGANHIEHDTDSPIPAGAAQISFWAKWQYGNPHLVSRFWNNEMPETHRLPVPTNVGTPGAVNSVRQANLGPLFSEVAHTPVVPSASNAVTVTARLSDPHGVATAAVYYKGAAAPIYTPALLRDDGAGGDAAAGDGLYTAQLPAHAAGQSVAFYLQATDGADATNTWPRDISLPALYRVESAVWNPQFPTYRIVMTAAAETDLFAPPRLSNDQRNCTFIYEERDVYYGCGVRLIGSPAHRRDSSNPGYTGFKVSFNADEKLHGIKWMARFDDLTNAGYRDRLNYDLLRKMGQPSSQHEWIDVRLNARAEGVHEDILPPGKRFLNMYYPGGADGQLFELYPRFWFRYDNDTYCTNEYTRDFLPWLWWGAKKDPYRWYIRIRNHDAADDYTNVISLVDVFSRIPNSTTTAEVAQHFNIEQWARMIAVRTVNSNTDFDGRKNAYIYRPSDTERWEMLAWDCEASFGTGNVNLNIWTSLEQQVEEFLRFGGAKHHYLGAIYEYLEKYFNHGYLDPWIDHYYAVRGGYSPTTCKTFITNRRTYLYNQLTPYLAPNVPLAIATAEPVTVLLGTIELAGEAPVDVRWIRYNGEDFWLEWDDATHWRVTINTVPRDANSVLLELLDFDKRPLGAFTLTVHHPGGTNAKWWAIYD